MDVIIALFRLLVIITVTIGMGKVFVKAGQLVWAVLIPLYNLTVR